MSLQDILKDEVQGKHYCESCTIVMIAKGDKYCQRCSNDIVEWLYAADQVYLAEIERKHEDMTYGQV